MNRTMRRVGLLMLGMTAACAGEVGPPSEAEPQPSVPKAVSAPVPKRDGVLLSRTVREQLAARGIQVYGGSKPEPERATVEQKWIVPGYEMSRITTTDPTTVPLRYSTQLGIRWPLFVKAGAGAPYIDPANPGEKGSCSGTLVAGDAVLTAAHCVITWQEIGNNLTTGAPVQKKVRAYSIKARALRNGNSKPHGESQVRKSYWPFNDWPSAATGGFAQDHDYAILRLASPPAPAIFPAPLRTITSPPGTFIEFAHYPFAFTRENARLYHSVGDIDTTSGGLVTPFAHVYRHRASLEPGSSGAGIFEFGMDGVAGLAVSEDAAPPAPFVRTKGQMRAGFPNQVLMFTPTYLATINGWITAP